MLIKSNWLKRTVGESEIISFLILCWELDSHVFLYVIDRIKSMHAKMKKSIPYSRKIWRFGDLVRDRQY